MLKVFKYKIFFFLSFINLAFADVIDVNNNQIKELMNC